MNNAILISETDGVVSHHFCEAAYAQRTLDEAALKGRGCSAMLQEDELLDISFVYDVSPDLRNRVESAKSKLREDLRIQAVFDKHGVPKDRAIRSAVYTAFKELNAS